VKHQSFGPRDELHIRAQLKQKSSSINRGSAPTDHCHASAAIGLKIGVLKAVRYELGRQVPQALRDVAKMSDSYGENHSFGRYDFASRQPNKKTTLR
jgi:hypothetical protein